VRRPLQFKVQLHSVMLGHELTVGLRLHLILTAEGSLLRQVIDPDTDSSPNCTAVSAQSSRIKATKLCQGGFCS
jgi:hypothetical protein